MILEKAIIGIVVLIAHFFNGSSWLELGSGIKPDFMVLLVVFFALRRGPLYGLWVGFFGGILTDSGLGAEIQSNGQMEYMIGLHSLTFSMMGYLTGKFARSAYQENFLSIMVYAFFLTLFTRIATYYIFLFFFHENANYSFVYTSVYNALMAPVVFYIMSWIFKMDSGDM